MSDYYESRPRRAKGMHRYFKYFAGAVLLAIAGMAAVHFFIVKPLGGLTSPIEKFSNALGSVTQRKVNVKGHTITLESSETRELIVIKRKTQSVVKYTSKWLGSEKLVIVQGDFVLKAGFNLSEFEGFEVKGKEVIGEWPEPRLLSVEPVNMEIFYSKSGRWNKLSDQDYEAVQNLLIQQARRDALMKSNILEEADRIIQTRLNDLTGGELEFRNHRLE